MLTMREDALLKAIEGKIPFVEVNKLKNKINNT
jgi:hypothetical protein